MQKRYLETTFFIKIVILKARFYINLDLDLNDNLNFNDDLDQLRVKS